jgi:hypothetical protein
MVSVYMKYQVIRLEEEIKEEMLLCLIVKYCQDILLLVGRRYCFEGGYCKCLCNIVSKWYVEKRMLRVDVT